MDTISAIIAAAPAENTALAATADSDFSQEPLTYGRLAERIAETTAQFRQIGIARGDRVAIVLPNGAEMASAFLAVAASCSAAPLNPAYRGEEFRFYLEDLKARAIILMRDVETPAEAVATALNIPVLWLEKTETAGDFRLDCSAGHGAEPAADGPAEAQDEALVLHTSGTTSRPKVVPLSGANITRSACNIRDTLKLTMADCGLNIMPMFHIHGLIASLLSSMAAGGQVVCSPGFNALKIFSWFEQVKPSWYTGVPTMHQAIISRAGRNSAIIESLNLRFVRSSSSSLPPPVMEEVEQVFGCPVIEAYGMTEAAHQMASNPLPPAQRKPGSVGIAAGPEIRILDQNGNAVADGGTGEICIRGANVFAGYENNPDANAEAFHGPWFRTGDQGFVDTEGYLTISGRLKEIINRGGEKIAPREVDDVIQAHPAVAQIVCFAMPHPKLGEEVAAVVVLQEGMTATEAELKAFAAEKLADFKIPRSIHFMDEIPKGATGKLQRIGLAEKLGLC